jgi:hypothetical protein
MNWRLKHKIIYLVCLLICLGGVSLALSKQQGVSSESTRVERSNSLSVEQLQKLAQTITVKITTSELLGSGTLLQRQGQIYTVITNAHVLRTAKPTLSNSNTRWACISSYRIADCRVAAG